RGISCGVTYVVMSHIKRGPWSRRWTMATAEAADYVRLSEEADVRRNELDALRVRRLMALERRRTALVRGMPLLYQQARDLGGRTPELDAAEAEVTGLARRIRDLETGCEARADAVAAARERLGADPAARKAFDVYCAGPAGARAPLEAAERAIG